MIVLGHLAIFHERDFGEVYSSRLFMYTFVVDNIRAATMRVIVNYTPA